MYVCNGCYREFTDKPNGRCPSCGSLVRKDFKRDDKRGKKGKYRLARRAKQSEDWGD